jgi:hypothetical protein
MTRERLFGALVALWVIFALIILVLSTFLSPAGFQPPLPGRGVAETVMSVLLYVPPVVALFLWFQNSSQSELGQRSSVVTRMGWALAITLGFLVALLIVPAAKTLFIG